MPSPTEKAVTRERKRCERLAVQYGNWIRTRRLEIQVALNRLEQAIAYGEQPEEA
jgi:hypothetical protein